MRVSLGALRDHVLHEDFVADLHGFLATSGLPPERLELRIAEKIFVARISPTCVRCSGSACSSSSTRSAATSALWPLLARAPVWGLQLDRAWVQALGNDAVARNVCRAGISVARALSLTPIATGVDDEAQRQALLELGCQYGIGDLSAALRRAPRRCCTPQRPRRALRRRADISGSRLTPAVM